MPNRRSLCAAAVALPWLSWLPLASRAQGAPDDRPIRLVVPYGAGTATDNLARQLGNQVQVLLQQPIIIDNRPGAGGITGADLVARSAPDGLTLLVGTTQTHAISPALFRRCPYDPIADFAPVAGLASQAHVLVVGTALAARSVGELVAMAKAQPGRLSFASTGNGTPAHLVGKIFKREAGIEIVHVPYPGGAQALTDVMTGTVSMMFYPYQPLKPHVEGGKMRALASADVRRPEWLQNVPNMVEAGYPKSVIAAWFGIYAPARTPAERIAVVSDAFRKVLASAEMQSALPTTGTTIQSQSPAELAAFTASEVARYKSLVALSGAKVD